jgi:pilus assembly protein CpaD
MTKTGFRSATRIAGAAISLSLGLALAGCGGIATNKSLDSIHQPVVERTNFTLDVSTGPGGLSYPEQRRLTGWFESLSLRYGDRIAIDDPLQSEATRSAIAAVAGRYGLLLSDDAPVTPGHVEAGTARVVLTRSKARVPGCPDWSSNSENNFNNATSTNFGCAVNSNFAAMVADPEHLLKGADGHGETVVMSSNKAIDSYRTKKPTGAGDLSAIATQKGN